MEPTDIKIQEALQNANEWVAYLATRPDAELVRRLDTNRFQYEIAHKKNDVKLCEFMEILFHIIVQARIYKDEHQIPDEISEITLEVSQMEHIIAQEEVRQDTMEYHQLPNVSPRHALKIKLQQDNSNQTSLF